LRRIVSVRLFERTGAVPFDCFDRVGQQVGDFFGAASLNDQAEHAGLPVVHFLLF